MTMLLIVFITAVLAGLVFWFYNKRQVNNLSQQLEDKNAVINAFRNHVQNTTQTEVDVESNFSRNTLNDEWRGATNLTPTVEDALPNKPKKKKQKNYGQSQQNQQKTQNPKQNSDNKNRSKKSMSR